MQNKYKIYDFLHDTYHEFTNMLVQTDSMAHIDNANWNIENLGHGITCSVKNGQYIEKAGMGISFVSNALTPVIAQALKIPYKNHIKYQACGISIIIHPDNPYIPSFHANTRHIQIIDDKNNTIQSWFGGGLDLSPYLIIEEDIIEFHKNIQNICDRYQHGFYETHKAMCDEYFYLPHRKEHRGVGGIFIDKMPDADNDTDFIKNLTKTYMPQIIKILQKRQDMQYTSLDKKWQLIRRGRYVEFNLLYDRGTLFGLKTNGRIESILMSLPPMVSWEYEYENAIKLDDINNIKYKRIMDIIKQPIDWAKCL